MIINVDGTEPKAVRRVFVKVANGEKREVHQIYSNINGEAVLVWTSADPMMWSDMQTVNGLIE